MLLQKSQIGKTAVVLIILTLLATLAAMPLFLQADSTGGTTPEANLFLPVIYNEDDLTPNPSANATSTPTLTASPTIHPTITASATPSATSTSIEPYIVLMPDCGPGPNIFFYIQGYNWPEDESITVTWNGTPIIFLPAIQHSGSFSIAWTSEGMTSGLYMVSAVAGTNGATASDYYTIPCGAAITPTSTPTPEPADLVIGQPILISTPPVVAYQPLAFEVPITNTGDIAINDLFFVDLLFDPTPVHNSDVYAAVSGLGSNSSMTLTITSTVGLANFLGTHQVTGWVDSLDNVVEADETNNLSVPFEIIVSEPAGTPTNTPVPNGTATISGVARVFLSGSYISQERMLISAIDETSGIIIATTYSDENGFYQFDNLTDGSSYTVTACMTIDNNEYFGIRMNRTAPNAFTDIFASEGTCQ